MTKSWNDQKQAIFAKWLDRVVRQYGEVNPVEAYEAWSDGYSPKEFVMILRYNERQNEEA